MAVPEEMDAFRLRVVNSADEIVEDRPVPVGPGRAELPASFGIAPREGRESERVTVEVDANRGGVVLFSTRAVTGFVKGRVLRLDLFLAGRCLEETCDADETCRPEGCVPPEIDPADLPGLDEDCDRDADGHASTICGGDDCDDSRADVHPGAPDPPVWSAALVDDSGDVEDVSMSIAPDGATHLVYFRGDGATLWYATDEDGAFEPEARTPGAAAAMRGADIVVDRAGDVHLCWGEPGAGLWISRRDAGVWTDTLADASAGAGAASSIAVGDDDTVHVAYTNDAGELRHLEWLGEGSTPVVGPPGTVPTTVSLGMVGDDVALVAVTDAARADLRVLRFEGATASSEIVDSDGSIGGWASLAVDDAGVAHVAYLDRTDGALAHAVSGEARVWSVESAELGMDFEAGSLATHADRRVAVAFVAGTAPGDARYAQRSNLGWRTELVDGRATSATSVAFTPEGAPIVATVAGGDLYVANRTAPIDRDCDGEDE